MITIKYELYYNDYNFSHRTEELKDLNSVKEWIYKKMRVKEYEKWIRLNYDPAYITIQPEGPGMNLHIHQIEDKDGILFSDGEYTNGLSHCADCIRKWIEELKKDIKSPKFNFINK